MLFKQQGLSTPQTKQSWLAMRSCFKKKNKISKFSAPQLRLISAVSRDLQLKENTRLVPRKRMGLQLSS